MSAFTGQLNTNELFAALFNMIISQEVFSDNIKGVNGGLADQFKTEGSLYGDTKLYYATDALHSQEWGADAEAANLLEVKRPDSPKCQAIQMDVYRMVFITVDNYLSKKAWSTEGAFSNFTAVTLGWLGETKRIYDATTVNAFVGTTHSGVADITVPLAAITADTTLNTKEKNELEGETIAQTIADLLIGLKDCTRDYNDYGFMRSYDESDLKIVWNSAYVNKIRKVDLPTIFHNEGLVDKFAEEVLPAKYFGTVNSAATDGLADGSVKSLIEQDIGDNHYFAGEAIKEGDTAPAGTSYTVDPKVICKVIHRRSVPWMSAFETGTSFFNPRSLTDSHYLIWGHNTLEYLKDKPFLTLVSD